MSKFDEFIAKEKFLQEAYYPGIADPTMRPVLTEKINQVANDFKILSESSTSEDKDYHDKIKLGLDRFVDLYINLDTEDRERICSYFEELMDLVALESSGGHLNNFMYGFDPSELK